MSVPAGDGAPWLLLILTIPTQRASARVEIWRKLKRTGALSLRTSGYVLPNNPETLERFEWIAAEVRKHKGQASVAQVQSFDDLSDERLIQLFVAERSKDYESVIRELRRANSGKANVATARRRFHEIVAIDFFTSPMQAKVQAVITGLENESLGPSTKRRGRNGYKNQTWITRHRPGIDRSASAWLIQRFIDPNATFVFGRDSKQIPGAIPFDMFGADGFGHRGSDCTFETLCKEFTLKDRRVRDLAEIIHDADLHDEKYGRTEGLGIDSVLKGWAKQQVSDEELLRRGIELVDGLYEGLA